MKLHILYKFTIDGEAITTLKRRAAWEKLHQGYSPLHTTHIQTLVTVHIQTFK